MGDEILRSLDDDDVALSKVDSSDDEFVEAADYESANEDVAIAVAPKRRATTEPLQRYSIKRRRSDTSERQDDRLRVGCPFYRKDPSAHAATTSCHGKGFCEMGKLKDHLKDRHRISKDMLQRLNFKKGEFTSLRTMEAKWKLVFQILFPEVLEEDIPHPCESIVEPSIDPKDLLEAFKARVFSEYGYTIRRTIPNLAKRWDTLSEEVIQEYRGIPSPNPGLSRKSSAQYLPTPQTTPAIKLDDWSPEPSSMSTDHNAFPHPLGIQDFPLFSSSSSDSAAALLDDYSTYFTGASSDKNYEFQPSASSFTIHPAFPDSSSHDEQKYYTPTSPSQDIDQSFGGNGTQAMCDSYERKYSQSSMNSDEFDKLYDLPSLPKDIEFHPELTNAMFSSQEIAIKIEAESQSDPYVAPGSSFLGF